MVNVMTHRFYHLNIPEVKSQDKMHLALGEEYNFIEIVNVLETFHFETDNKGCVFASTDWIFRLMKYL